LGAAARIFVRTAFRDRKVANRHQAEISTSETPPLPRGGEKRDHKGQQEKKEQPHAAEA